MGSVKESGNFVLTVDLEGDLVAVSIDGLGHFMPWRSEDESKLSALIGSLSRFRERMFGNADR